MQKAALLLDEDLVRALHIGEVAFSYYQVQRPAPSEQDYKEWLTLLPDLLRERFESMGYESGKSSVDFCAYFTELRNKEMIDYMRAKLSPEDFNLWLEKRDTPASLD